MSIRRRQKLFLRIFRAYAKAEMMSYACKGAIWSCWSAGLRSSGDRLVKVSKITPNIIVFSFLK